MRTSHILTVLAVTASLAGASIASADTAVPPATTGDASGDIDHPVTPVDPPAEPVPTATDDTPPLEPAIIEYVDVWPVPAPARAATVTNPRRERPTRKQARAAAHITLDSYADLVDGRLIVGPCNRRGAYTTVCRARIDGPSKYRYQILVTGTRRANFLVTVRKR